MSNEKLISASCPFLSFLELKQERIKERKQEGREKREWNGNASRMEIFLLLLLSLLLGERRYIIKSRAPYHRSCKEHICPRSFSKITNDDSRRVERRWRTDRIVELCCELFQLHGSNKDGSRFINAKLPILQNLSILFLFFPSRKSMPFVGPFFYFMIMM